MKNLILLGLIFSFTAAFAGESGYIENGKTHVVFKDGKKIGEWPAQPAKRDPANFKRSISSNFYFTDDDSMGVRCYSTETVTSGGPISCVKR